MGSRNLNSKASPWTDGYLPARTRLLNPGVKIWYVRCADATLATATYRFLIVCLWVKDRASGVAWKVDLSDKLIWYIQLFE